jgi:hypothetical protein
VSPSAAKVAEQVRAFDAVELDAATVPVTEHVIGAVGAASPQIQQPRRGRVSIAQARCVHQRLGRRALFSGALGPRFACFCRTLGCVFNSTAGQRRAYLTKPGAPRWICRDKPVERAYLPKPRARQRISAHKPALTVLEGAAAGVRDGPGAGMGRRS